MAWTAEKVKAMRESNPAKATESDGWTAEKVRAMRTKTPTAGLPSQAADAASSPKGGALGIAQGFFSLYSLNSLKSLISLESFSISLRKQ